MNSYEMECGNIADMPDSCSNLSKSLWKGMGSFSEYFYLLDSAHFLLRASHLPVP